MSEGGSSPRMESKIAKGSKQDNSKGEESKITKVNRIGKLS